MECNEPHVDRERDVEQVRLDRLALAVPGKIMGREMTDVNVLHMQKILNQRNKSAVCRRIMNRDMSEI